MKPKYANKISVNVCECCGEIKYHNEMLVDTHNFNNILYYAHEWSDITEQRIQKKLDEGWMEVELLPSQSATNEGMKKRGVIPPLRKNKVIKC